MQNLDIKYPKHSALHNIQQVNQILIPDDSSYYSLNYYIHAATNLHKARSPAMSQVTKATCDTRISILLLI